MERQQRSGGRVLMVGYSALLGLGLAASAPWWLVRMATTARYREGLPERLGRVPRRLRTAVRGKRVVWVHAVSVGEVLAVSRLVRELETALNTDPLEDRLPWTVVVSTTTRTGQSLARERFGAERVFYYPLDFAWAVRAFLRALRPAMVVLAESELWPRMLHECAQQGVPVTVVNARVSDRSFRRAMRVRAVWGPVLRRVKLFLAQTEADAGRLRALGARDGAVRVSGNLKYDVRAPRESPMSTILRKAIGDRPLVVAGSTVDSTHDRSQNGEEAQIAEEWSALRLSCPSAVLLVAPRHPERFAAVAAVMAQYGVVRASELEAGKTVVFATEQERQPGENTVILLDTIGDLASVYALASVAFVGGSLVQAGGHNPLEPARFGVPVVIGLSFENFRDVVEKMREADAICIAEDRFQLAAMVRRLLLHPAEARAMGERGRAVFEREGGATARCIEALMPLLGQPEIVQKRDTLPMREAVGA